MIMAGKPVGAARRDPLADALLNAEPSPSRAQNAVDRLFGDRPEVLDAIVVAARDRKLQYSQIAKVLTKESGTFVSAGSVSGWLKKKGL